MQQAMNSYKFLLLLLLLVVLRKHIILGCFKTQQYVLLHGEDVTSPFVNSSHAHILFEFFKKYVA